MSLVQYQPKQGAWKAGLADQTAIDWQMLVNCQVVNGLMEPRPGWEVLNCPSAYASAADANTQAGFSYTVSSTAVAWNLYVPLGAHLFSRADGGDWVIAMWRAATLSTTWVQYTIHTTTGRLIATGVLNSTNASPPVTDFTLDEPKNTYVFVRLYDTVFFTNGGTLWKWEPLRYLPPVPVQAYRNPLLTADASPYVTGYLRGAKIVVAHQNSVVYAGFSPDEVVTFDTNINIGLNGAPIQTDQGKAGGLPTGPGNNSCFLNAYTIAASDDQLPNCVSSKSIKQIPSQMPVTAMASHMGRLVVLTTCETWVIVGAMAEADSWSIQPVSRGVGCAGPRCIAQSDDGLLCWLGNDGVYAWDGSGPPKDVTAPILQLFRQGIGTFFRWAFTPDSPDINDVATPFLRAQTQVGDLASMTWVSKDNYFAIALSSGIKSEPNDIVLCWSPSDNRWWCTTTYGEQTTWQFVSRGGSSGYWAPLATTYKSIIVGHHTLLVSQNEQGKMFCQGWRFTATNNEWAAGHGALAVMQHKADQGGIPVIDPVPTDVPYGALAVSAPIFLGDSDDKLMRRLHIQMRGLRRRSMSADEMEVRLFFLPEYGPLDVQNQTETTSVASERVIEAWPECYTTSIYFYDTTPGSSFNKWGGYIPSTGLNVPTTDAKVPRWLGEEPIDLRIDIPAKVGRWFRIGIAQVLDGTAGPGFSILSAGIEVVGGYGQRK